MEPSASKCVPSVIKCKEDIANAATNVAPFGVKNESQECVLLQFTILHANFLMLLIFCENATREWLFAELSTRTDDGTRVVSEIYPKTFQ